MQHDYFITARTRLQLSPAASYHFLNLFWLYLQLFFLGYINVHLELGDFEPFPNISVQVVADNIVIQTIDDNITLEYNDRINLVFTLSSEEADLLQMLEAEGEYLRDTASVTIIDNDGKKH